MNQFTPLRGIRILAFEVVASLPAATRMLSDWGAEVLRIMRPGGRGGQLVSRLDNVEIGKSSLCIDLRKTAGRELARRLAFAADVVCNNFTPRVMHNFGLDYDSLSAFKQDLIYLQLSGYGAPGPWSNFPAFGPSVEAASGLYLLTGNEGDPPVKAGSDVLADFVSGRYAAFAVQCALLRRELTGKGEYIDLSMHECIVHLEGHFLSAGAAGIMPRRLGNRDRVFAPQGIYPCAGEDEWVSIAATNDTEWRALCGVIGDELLPGDAPNWSCVERRAKHDSIDAAISGWTSVRQKGEIAELLQERGVPAGPVLRQSDIHFDRHLIEREFFQLVEHTHPIFRAKAHPYMQLMPCTEGFPRPRLSEASIPPADDERILRDWLQLKPKAVRNLQDQEVLLAMSLGEPTVAALGSRGSPVDPEFAEKMGLPMVEPQS